ncbi:MULTISPECIES: hypothetical protein [Priestia]|uniref:hypothetical protein n=1 Tax=Priestia TaxID=2800373 RepID=UPI00112AD3DB|nr:MULTISPECIES: hypothetical protein [Priestia]
MSFIEQMTEQELKKWREQSPTAKQETFELIENAVVIDITTGEEITDKVSVKPNLGSALPHQVQYKQREDEVAKYNAEQGGFVFTFYKLAERIDGDLTKADLARLLFLATYLSYESNQLKFDNGVAITKKQLPELLGLKERAFRTFYGTVTQLGILVDNGDKVVMSAEYFYKGSLPKTIKPNEIAYTRTYVNGIRELYKEYGATRKAGQLGLLYLVIPYIHFDTNILVSNPNERQHADIEALSLEEVAMLLGYDANKITRTLTGIVLGDEYVFMITQVGKEKNVVVNPRVHWRGTSVPSGTVDTLFQIKKRKGGN